MDKQKLESQFQNKLIKRIKSEFGNDNVIILKNDPNYIQGFPDLTILGKKRYAILECKRSKNEHKQPNQEFYVNKANRLSYGRFIYPENEQQVLSDMKEYNIDVVNRIENKIIQVDRPDDYKSNIQKY